MRTKQHEIPAAVRTAVGKSAARQLRAQRRIPAVVYGRGMEAIPIAVDEAVFSQAVPEVAWFSSLFQLRIEGLKEGDDSPNCMIKEVQQDLVRQRLLSIDFHRVSLQETIHAQVPVLHVGESPGVKQGGILEQLLHEVAVECLPTAIPDHLEVDVSSLEISDSARVGDLSAPEGVKLITPAEEVVLVVAPPQQVEEEPVAEEETAEVVEEREEPELIGEKEPETETPSA